TTPTAPRRPPDVARRSAPERRPTGPAGVAHDPATGHPTPPGFTAFPEHHEPTPFQQAVVDAVASLAPGEVVTYGEIAEEIGRPGSGQAVANVLRHAPDLPWWRVVPADGRLYRTHAPVQAPLL